jgi:CRISPR-associated protein Cmr1
MRQLTYRITFHSPAFLGNAQQAGQWRTPPIKALLRQWWRVVFAAGSPRGGVVVDKMRHAEGLLFGHAWPESDRDEQGDKAAARRSQVRLRLDRWSAGRLAASQWPALPTVVHPEVPQPVAADLYLGYGPVTLPRGQRVPTLKANAAIQAGEAAVLRLAAPDEEAPRLQMALALMNLYGTLGGRSRNGWGSFTLLPLDGTPALARELPVSTTLPWRDALAHDWPQAVGSDARGALIWQTGPLPDWQQVMVQLAKLKIALRTGFEFPQQRPDGQVHDRHWLSYPVTKHEVAAWKRDGLRLPNSLRFKVRPEGDGKSLRGVVFHVPCLPPPAFRPQRGAIERVWQRVHEHLDADRSLQRAVA